MYLLLNKVEDFSKVHKIPHTEIILPVKLMIKQAIKGNTGIINYPGCFGRFFSIYSGQLPGRFHKPSLYPRTYNRLKSVNIERKTNGHYSRYIQSSFIKKNENKYFELWPFHCHIPHYMANNIRKESGGMFTTIIYEEMKPYQREHEMNYHLNESFLTAALPVYDSGSDCLPDTENTPNTTRFQGRDQYQTGVAVSEAVWNNLADPMKRAGAVILARGDGLNFQDALVGSSLIHFPRNGPVLLTEPTGLNPLVAREIFRLNPSGKESPAQVLTIGSLSLLVDEAVRRLGYTVCRIDGGTPAATAVLIWNILGAKQNVMLVSGERFEAALPAAGYAAHEETPILLTCVNYLPPVTAQAIIQRQPNVYIIGNESSVSAEVEATVRKLTGGLVYRITGADPFTTAVNFTKYKSPAGDFGWDVNRKAGWSFRFSRFDQWYGAINGNPLSHLGKHSPLLLIYPQAIPMAVAEYIKSLNPIHREPKPPFMHGFLVGNVSDIACPVQWQLDSLLETVGEHE